MIGTFFFSGKNGEPLLGVEPQRSNLFWLAVVLK